MRTGTDTGSAADTLIKIEADMVFMATVIAISCRAESDTLIATDALFCIDIDDVGKFFHGNSDFGIRDFENSEMVHYSIALWEHCLNNRF
jgi:hypothetical protein